MASANMDNIDIDNIHRSEFELVFGCSPEEHLPFMQNISNAFIAPQIEENACKDCLGTDFIKQILNICQERYSQSSRYWGFATGESDELPSVEDFLFGESNRCYFCDFLRMHLRREIDGAVELNGTRNHRMYVTFWAPKHERTQDSQFVVYVGPVNAKDFYAPLGFFALAPLVGFQTDGLFDRPQRLRFSSGSPNDEASQLKVRQWVEDCHSHQRCRSQEPSLLPTRVIDVGTSELPGLHLHESKTQESDVYVTLSYCWGGYDGIKLTVNNLEAFKEGIDECQLPKTYADAIALTRQLGIRYLWIDALCILQDSVSDWEAQSALMHEVYGSSQLTICASNASNPSQGFLKDRDMTSYTHAYCGSLSHMGMSYPIYLTTSRKNVIEDLHGLGRPAGVLARDHLTSRAWAVQERLLSRRVLYFTDHEMIWQCRQGTYTEGGISTEPQPSLRSSDKSLNSKTWYDIVEKYANCNLSRASDRLPAIVGCARAFATLNYEVGYLAGHWINGLLESLVWWPRQKGHNILHQAPSWSWASLSQGVIFYRALNHELVPIADLLEHNAGEPQTQLSTSASPAFLKIRAPVAAGRIFCSQDYYEDGARDYVRLDIFPHIKIKTHSILDDDLPFATPVVMAILHRCRSEQKNSLQRYCGLVLKRVDEGSVKFQRIGMFWISTSSPRIGRLFFTRKSILLV